MEVINGSSRPRRSQQKCQSRDLEPQPQCWQPPGGTVCAGAVGQPRHSTLRCLFPQSKGGNRTRLPGPCLSQRVQGPQLPHGHLLVQGLPRARQHGRRWAGDEDTLSSAHAQAMSSGLGSHALVTAGPRVFTTRWSDSGLYPDAAGSCVDRGPALIWKEGPSASRSEDLGLCRCPSRVGAPPGQG